ncbi:MAG: hypothetical protein F6K49_22385 [Moorea sp. SIO3I6]|nr:hypothetical protein [Moorena sp. SIO3I6]
MILRLLWNGHLGGTGILVERASWWNWHLASFNIFPGGQDAHSTPIQKKIHQRRLFNVQIHLDSATNREIP